MKILSTLKEISNFVDKIIMKLVFVSIVGMIISISLQIFFRVFFDALTWSEEVSRYLLVWSTFLGATLAYKRSMHISVTFGVDFLKNKFRKAIIIINIFVCLIFFIVVVIFGFKYMAMQSTQVSAALRMPMKWAYCVIPVSAIVMVIHGITLMFEEIYSEEGM